MSAGIRKRWIQKLLMDEPTGIDILRPSNYRKRKKNKIVEIHIYYYGTIHNVSKEIVGN